MTRCASPLTFTLWFSLALHLGAERIFHVHVDVQVSPDDIDENLRDNLEHYMHCAGVPEFAEASRAPPFTDLVILLHVTLLHRTSLQGKARMSLSLASPV